MGDWVRGYHVSLCMSSASGNRTLLVVQSTLMSVYIAMCRGGITMHSGTLMI